jgi:hypothetical protein
MPERYKQASMVGDTAADDVEGRPVINARPHERQADSDINATFKTEVLEWNEALVVVLGDHDVEMALTCTQEHRVWGPWA